MDLTVEGKIYWNGGFETACLGIENGKIVAIKKSLKSDQHLNVGTNLILPCGIDLHVHFRDPGFPQKEDFSSGSLAAAFGGISCVFDMPNTQPPVNSISALQEKRQIASEKSYIDFGLYGTVTDDNIGKIAELSPLCHGYKIFLGSTTHAFDLRSKNLPIALHETSRTKKPTMIHAEDEYCLKKHEDIERTLIDHLRCRSAECEELALKNVLTSVQDLNSPIHICHLSSCEGFETLRNRPPHISVGVTPHHLLFDVHKISSHPTWYKTNPPIRSSFDRETLWHGVNHGGIDVIESDHAPHTMEDKDVEFSQAPVGIPGVETMYPLFLALVKKEQMKLGTLLSLLCERPAQIMHLPKGKLEVGRDADFIIVDFKKTDTIKTGNLHSRSGWTPFEGYAALFPTLVFIRGEKIIDDRQMLVKPGFGKFIGD